MDQAEALDLAHKYEAAVREKFEFKKFILFGSYVKGNFRTESDIDIAIVFDDFDDRWERQIELMRLSGISIVG